MRVYLFRNSLLKRITAPMGGIRATKGKALRLLELNLFELHRETLRFHCIYIQESFSCRGRLNVKV